MRFEEYVYNSLLGNLQVPHAEVNSLFEEGMPCEKWYAEMREAYSRLCKRLGSADEDDDVETIISMLWRIQREISLHMYQYGAKFNKK